MTGNLPSAPQTTGSSSRAKTLAPCCSIHFLHDGCADALYALFPLMALDLHLSFAQLGFLKTAYPWALSPLQVPASLVVERAGEASPKGGGILDRRRFRRLIVIAMLTIPSGPPCSPSSRSS
jgi:hypothetical protein